MVTYKIFWSSLRLTSAVEKLSICAAFRSNKLPEKTSKRMVQTSAILGRMAKIVHQSYCIALMTYLLGT